MSTFMELFDGKVGKAKTMVDRVRVTTSGKMYYRMNGKQVGKRFGSTCSHKLCFICIDLMYGSSFQMIEIENRPLDGVVTLFLWLSENSSYIRLCRYHVQAER